MAEMTEEEKYRRKAIILQRALAAAEEMDKTAGCPCSKNVCVAKVKKEFQCT
jgi:hypothetical protein